MSIQIFCTFSVGQIVFLLLSYKRSVYILDAGPFSDIYMNGDISILWVVLSLSFLFYFIYCFFIFLRVSFEAQKFLVLMKFNLSIFSLITYAFDVMSKKPLPNPR